MPTSVGAGGQDQLAGAPEPSTPTTVPPAARGRPGRAGRAAVTAATVLIVDDSLVIRAVVRDGLESEGYQVIEAIDGLDGLHQCRNNPPDVVLSTSRCRASTATASLQR